jgi:hypothetical protein
MEKNDSALDITDVALGNLTGNGVANGRILDQGGPATPAARVPTLMPIGIAALGGLLSIIATNTILKRKKR